MNDDRTPVLVGVGQLVQRDADPREALSPWQMLEIVARDAASDAGAGDRLLHELDTVALVNMAGGRAQNAPFVLGELLGAKPRWPKTSSKIAATSTIGCPLKYPGVEAIEANALPQRRHLQRLRRPPLRVRVQHSALDKGGGNRSGVSPLADFRFPHRREDVERRFPVVISTLKSRPILNHLRNRAPCLEAARAMFFEE